VSVLLNTGVHPSVPELTPTAPQPELAPLRPAAVEARPGSLSGAQRDALADKAIAAFTKVAGLEPQRAASPFTPRLENAQRVFFALRDQAEADPSAQNVAKLAEFLKTMEFTGGLSEGGVRNYGLPSADAAVEAITGLKTDGSASMQELMFNADANQDGKLAAREVNAAQGTTPKETAALKAAQDYVAEMADNGVQTVSRDAVTEALRDKAIDGQFGLPVARQP
jgi:hypothetical protein